MSQEKEPHHLGERNKFLNLLDESFGFLFAHISNDILFHLKRLKNPKESLEKLELLLGKKDGLWGHILDKDLISLQPSSFETIQHFFTKYISLALQCKQCGIERKDAQLALSVLNKLGYEYFVFVSTFHSGRASIPNWNMPSLDSFVKSLIHEQDKLVQMGVLQTSKNQDILMSDLSNAQAKGKHKGKETKASDSNPK